MPRTGIEPVTRGFSVLCSTNWAIWAYSLCINKNLVAGIGFEPMTFGLWARRASRLLHPAILCFNVSFKKRKPMIGLEPITCWLQISCSANWATSAHLDHGLLNDILKFHFRTTWTLSSKKLAKCSISMDGGGFEPPKQLATDLQSAPFGHSGIHPN